MCHPIRCKHDSTTTTARERSRGRSTSRQPRGCARCTLLPGRPRKVLSWSRGGYLVRLADAKDETLWTTNAASAEYTTGRRPHAVAYNNLRAMHLCARCVSPLDTRLLPEDADEPDLRTQRCRTPGARTPSRGMVSVSTWLLARCSTLRSKPGTTPR